MLVFVQFSVPGRLTNLQCLDWHLPVPPNLPPPQGMCSCLISRCYSFVKVLMSVVNAMDFLPGQKGLEVQLGLGPEP